LASVRHEIEHRHGHAADEQARDFAGHEGDGEAFEDRVGESRVGADADGQNM
jgi:hypothetical protein